MTRLDKALENFVLCKPDLDMEAILFRREITKWLPNDIFGDINTSTPIMHNLCDGSQINVFDGLYYYIKDIYGKKYRISDVEYASGTFNIVMDGIKYIFIINKKEKKKMEDKYTKIIDKISKDLGSKISKGFALDNKVYVSIEKVYDTNSRGTERGICGYGETYEGACHNYFDLLCAAKNPVCKGYITIDTSGFEEFREKETDKVNAIEKAVSELKYFLGLGVDIKYVGNRVDGRFFNSSRKITITRRLECTKDGQLYAIIGSSPNRPVRKIFLELAINGVLQGPGIENNGLEFIIPEFEFCDSDDCLRIRGLLDRIKDENAKVVLDELKDYLKRKILVTYTGSDEDFICGNKSLLQGWRNNNARD